jgi:WXXGXW repeat (2 copies)
MFIVKKPGIHGKENTSMRNIRFVWLALLIIIPVSSFAGVVISVNIAPPVLPVYEQPPCPGDGYIWTPGYWAYGPEGYYWVPGTWATPPTVGLLWTPG